MRPKASVDDVRDRRCRRTCAGARAGTRREAARFHPAAGTRCCWPDLPNRHVAGVPAARVRTLDQGATASRGVAAPRRRLVWRRGKTAYDVPELEWLPQPRVREQLRGAVELLQDMQIVGRGPSPPLPPWRALSLASVAEQTGLAA